MNRSIPARDETDPYYYRYIDLVPETDVVGVLERQLPETLAFLGGISDEKSRYRYSSEKWSIRQLLSHVCDTERVMLFRAFWFARGFTTPLPGWDQDPSAVAARADEVPFVSMLDEIQAVRLSTLAFFHNMPEEAWDRSGVASERPFTVRALAYIIAGHLLHHVAVLKERYF